MTNNIVTAHVTIKGLRPLWFHRFGPEAMPLEKGEKTGVAGNDPEEWRRTVSVKSTGQLCLDAACVFAAMRDGAKYTKQGRGSLQPAVAATLQVVESSILIDRWFPGFPSDQPFDVKTAAVPPTDPDLSLYLDIRGVRNPTTKGRNVRYRVACAAGWQSTFSLTWDKTVVSRPAMNAIAIDAGKLCGLGNGRSIGMGRFEVVAFDVDE